MLFSNSSHKKAVCYYRHSAEDKQENSVAIQQDHAKALAFQNSVEIIHEEADEGKSGLLGPEARPGFRRLFEDWILNPNAPQFNYVFVYDESRWGRFQNPDEAAYYEFLCTKQGKKIIYVANGFPKGEQQLISHLNTSVKRYMAAEYSRELSGKVFHGCVKVSEQGYSAGGAACYGMTRVLLDENKKPIKTLGRGEWKSISNQRITFAPRNDSATETVKTVFQLLVKNWYRPMEIAETLNSKGILSANGGKWDSQKVLRILSNETYTGTRIYNKTWGRLKQQTRNNPYNEWIIRRNAFPAIVTDDLFKNAQEHLYWLMPSKWKRGVYKMNKVRKTVLGEIKNLFMSKGSSSEKADLFIRELPLIFGITFYKDLVPHWCFIISETTRNFDHVIGISIDLDRKDSLDRFFFIPTNDFNALNFLLFSENDPDYSDYKIERSKIEEKLLTFIIKN